MDYHSQMDGIQFVRKEYTHLDPHLLQDNNLGSDLFVEQEYVDELEAKIRQKEEGDVILAKTDFLFVHGDEITPAVIEVDVTSYDP